MADSKVGVAFGVVRILAVPVVLETPFIDPFMKDTFRPELRIVRYNSKPVPIIVIENMPAEPNNKNKDKAQHKIVTEEDALRLVRVERPTKNYTKVKTDYFSLDRRQKASTNRTTTRVGQYVSMDDSLGHFRGIPELVI